MYTSIDQFMDTVRNRNAGEVEFHQAVHEVVESLWDFLQDNPSYLHAKILDRIVEPERVIQFRVPWRNDRGEVEVIVDSVWNSTPPLDPIRVDFGFIHLSIFLF